MVTIPVQDFKKFLSISKFIKENGILPMLSFVHLVVNKQGMSLVRDNLNSFVYYKNDDIKSNSEIDVLLDYKSLSAFVSSTTAESIKFTVQERQEEKVLKITVKMDDGKTKFNFESMEPSSFPKLRTWDFSDAILIDQDVLAAIYCARSHASKEDKGMPWTRQVYIVPTDEGCYVFATDGFLFYHKQFKVNLPSVYLTPDEYSVISNMTEVEYSSTEKYHFYRNNGVVYGFIRTEDKPADMTPLIQAFSPDQAFTVSKKEIVDYCSLIENSSITKYPICSIVDAGRSLKLVFNDSTVGRESGKELPVEGKKKHDFVPFNFKPSQMVALLNSITTDAVTFHNMNKGNIYVKDPEDENYMGLIRHIMDNPNAVAEN